MVEQADAGRTDDSMTLHPIGRVASPLVDPAAAPRQGDEGAPEAWIEFRPDLREAVASLAPGEDVLIITWLHRADRDVLFVHPRDDASRPVESVFRTRSADRPNPIGLHRARVLEVDGERARVGGLEAVDGTPILDVKPVLGPIDDR